MRSKPSITGPRMGPHPFQAKPADSVISGKLRNYRAQWCTPKNAILWTPQLTPHAHPVKVAGAELAFLLCGGKEAGHRGVRLHINKMTLNGGQWQMW